GPGHTAFLVLVNKLKDAGGLELPFQAHVMSSGMPNAFALPGGRIYLLDGLLQRARSPDELAGILAHELGHVQHRDGMRRLIQTGGTSFLFGLLFGDVTGAGAVIFVSRSMLDASYSRDAERNADAFAVGVMHKLGRSPTPSGELLFRITGAQTDKSLTILSSHPLTEERLAEMKKADRAATGPELLSAAQWAELKGICKWQAPNLRFDTLPGRTQSPQPKNAEMLGRFNGTCGHSSRGHQRWHQRWQFPFLPPLDFLGISRVFFAIFAKGGAIFGGSARKRQRWQRWQNCWEP